jgi:hypothetical protein
MRSALAGRHGRGAVTLRDTLKRATERSVGRTGLTLVCAVVIVLSTGAAGVSKPRAGASLTAQERHQYLLEFKPVVYFATGEDWSPIRVRDFLRPDRSQPERWDSTTRKFEKFPPGAPLPESTVGCVLTPCYQFNVRRCEVYNDACYEKYMPAVTDWTKGYVYGRFLDVPSSQPPPRGIKERPSYVARYWFFYFYDDWRSLKRRVWQGHEADWESVSFGLRSDFSLLYAAYSEHCSGTFVRLPSKIVNFEAGHPVVYVALGSHANYFDLHSSPPTYPVSCAVHYTNTKLIGPVIRLAKGAGESRAHLVDQLGTEHAFGPAATKHPLLELIDLDGRLPDWAKFAGRWSGEGQYLWAAVPHVRRRPRLPFGDGPSTPNFNGTSFKSFWHPTYG